MKQCQSILAIETSCDETAVAVVNNRTVCSSIVASQIPIHQQYGGVVPEVASRQHLETINSAIASALQQAQLPIAKIDAGSGNLCARTCRRVNGRHHRRQNSSNFA